MSKRIKIQEQKLTTQFKEAFPHQKVSVIRKVFWSKMVTCRFPENKTKKMIIRWKMIGLSQGTDFALVKFK